MYPLLLYYISSSPRFSALSCNIFSSTFFVFMSCAYSQRLSLFVRHLSSIVVLGTLL